MRLDVLGPLLVEAGGRQVAPGGPRQRAVLLHLALHAGRPVPAEQLLEEVWAADAPAAAANALQATVSRLRKLLPEGRLTTAPQGYVLRLADDETDAGRFAAAVASARWALADGKAAHAAALLREALDLWRGAALQDVRFMPFAQAEAARLDELHLVGIETWVEAELTRGAGRELVPELRRLTRDHPLRESLHGRLMVALYRAGRQAEALEVYAQLRTVLDAELGVEPSPALAGLMRAVLRQEEWLDHALSPPDDGTRAGPGTGSASAGTRRAGDGTGPSAAADDERPSATAPAAARRPVSVVHLVVRGAGRSGGPVDPEARQAAQRRLLRVGEPVVARHGGRLVTASAHEVTAVFGVPVLHEDDAERACRAASELVAALAPADVAVGVASGDAVLDPDQPGGMVTAAEDTARALAVDAPSGQVLLAPATYELAAVAVDAEPVAPQAFRLVEVGAVDRPPVVAESPLVDRTTERAVLDDVFTAVLRERRPHLVTLVGEAGQGKTRLAQDLAGRHADVATVLVGRCPPYGEGVTFSPLRQVVETICGGVVSREAVMAACAPHPQAEQVADRLLGALGAGDPGPGEVPETLWAARHLLTAVASRRPVLLVVDDIGWALPAMLDLVQSLVEQVRDVPLLVLCTARPELLEDRPDWPGAPSSGRAADRATVLDLGPLAPPDADRLAEELTGGAPVGPRLRDRLARTSGGNPLFLEQLVAATRDRAVPTGSDLPLPATVEAVLAARLDRLGPAELAVVATASVLGRECSVEDLTALLPREVTGYLGAHLRVLDRRALLASSATSVSFRHALVQQAAYRTLSKADRARLHQQAARRSQDVDADLATTGHHLALAARYSRELGDLDVAEPLARQAVDVLARAGEQLLAVGDADAAARSYELAAGLCEVDDPALLTGLGGALFESGRLTEARDVLAVAVAAAADGGDVRQRARAAVELLHVDLHLDPAAAEPRIDAEVSDLTAVLDGDPEGLARTAMLLAAVEWNRARSTAAEAAWRQAGAYAERAGDVRLLVQSRYWLASAAMWGPTPAADGVARCRRYLAEAAGSPVGRAIVGLHLAGLLAMTDRFDEARALLAESTAVLADVGAGLPTALTEPVAFVHALVGDVAAAEAVLRAAAEELEAIGERASFATCAAVLARTVVVQGPDRHPEAEDLVGRSWAAGGDHDVSALVIGRSVLGRVLAARGEAEAAVASARSAVELARRTDFSNQTADAYVDLADVLRSVGDPAAARDALTVARDLLAGKGNRPAVRACDLLLAEINAL